MKFYINPKINMSLTEFKKLFSDKFKHIVPDKRNEAMKAEYDRMIRAKAAHIAEEIVKEAVDNAISKVTEKKATNDTYKKEAGKSEEIDQSTGSKNDESEAAK